MIPRICGGCGGTPRRDDPLLTVHTSGGAYPACRDCTARLEGRPVADAPTYPAGVEYNWPVCGLCRRALLDGENYEPIRLHPDDMVGLEAEPGAYLACRECVEFFRPAISARIGREACGNLLL